MSAATTGMRLGPGLEEGARTFYRSLVAEQVAQANLLIGPGRMGKRRLLRALAAARLCADASANGPCGSCRHCRLVADGQHPDLLQAETPLKVDGLRRLLGELALRPVEASWRVALLPDIDQATPSAANALLKTLEEPPGRVLLLLSASRQELVLPTIRSRCRQVLLRPAAPDALAAYLVEAAEVDPSRAIGLARRAAGRLEWALAVAADPESERDLGSAMEDLEGLLQAPRSQRLRWAADMARRPEALEATLEAWLLWFRDALLCHLGMEAWVANSDRLPRLSSFGSGQDLATILGLIEAIEDALRRLQANSAAQLVLELLVLEFPT